MIFLVLVLILILILVAIIEKQKERYKAKYEIVKKASYIEMEKAAKLSERCYVSDVIVFSGENSFFLFFIKNELGRDGNFLINIYPTNSSYREVIKIWPTSVMQFIPKDGFSKSAVKIEALTKGFKKGEFGEISKEGVLEYYLEVREKETNQTYCKTKFHVTVFSV